MSNTVKSIHDIEEGGWGLYNGEWCVRPPGARVAAKITKHTVTEHEDGTITVEPSIVYSTSDRPDYYHGYLEHGVWREA